MTNLDRNQRMTLTGADDPAGKLLRSYWQPVALSSDLDDETPLPIKVMGEELVLFRDDKGMPGLLGLLCSHRCADLSYGRVEQGGLRCLYHGWLYDRTGRCLEQPAEPEESTYKDKIRHLSYPCIEKAGMIFAFMGSGDPPLLPNFHFMGAPETQVYAMKIYSDCNWLQALDGAVDPAHVSFLHNYERETPADEASSADHRTFRNIIFQQPKTKVDVERTRFGMRIYAERAAGEGKKFVRSTNYVFPNLAFIGGQGARQGQGGYSVHWHVPIDDLTHWRFDFYYQAGTPLDKEMLIKAKDAEIGPDHRMRRSRANRYLQNRKEMKTFSYSGMGTYFSAHDQFAIETPGQMHDRQREHLATSDVGVALMRRILLAGIDDIEGSKTPPMVLREEKDNVFNDIIVIGMLLDEDSDHRKAYAEIIEREDYHKCRV